MKTLRTLLREHMTLDDKRFQQMLSALALHDSNVESKHQSNSATMSRIEASQVTMQTSLDDIVRLRPAIEAGIAADKDAEYRKKMAKRVLVAVITTAVTFSGLIPLIQWLSSVHIHIGVS